MLVLSRFAKARKIKDSAKIPDLKELQQEEFQI